MVAPPPEARGPLLFLAVSALEEGSSCGNARRRTEAWPRHPAVAARAAAADARSGDKRRGDEPPAAWPAETWKGAASGQLSPATKQGRRRDLAAGRPAGSGGTVASLRCPGTTRRSAASPVLPAVNCRFNQYQDLRYSQRARPYFAEEGFKRCAGFPVYMHDLASAVNARERCWAVGRSQHGSARARVVGLLRRRQPASLVSQALTGSTLLLTLSSRAMSLPPSACPVGNPLDGKRRPWQPTGNPSSPQTWSLQASPPCV